MKCVSTICINVCPTSFSALLIALVKTLRVLCSLVLFTENVKLKEYVLKSSILYKNETESFELNLENIG